MSSPRGPLTVRAAGRDDVSALCDILNAVIALGGTTALEEPMGPAAFDAHFVGGPDCIACHLAETAAGEAVAFQALARHPALPAGWADIGTFARPGAGRSGAGTALFAATVRTARALGIGTINATIRADNPSGIPYYERMGFRTYGVKRGVPLRDGTPVDRVSKRFDVPDQPAA